MPDVVLVSMPFGPVFAPSLGLSLLKAGLARRHVPSQIQYFTIRFAEAVGQGFYTGLTDEDHPELTDLVGEWVFAKALFDLTSEDDARYVDEVLAGYSPAMIARILRAREAVDPFLDECLEAVVSASPKIVGFTSVFQQHAASLALARRLKRACPSTYVVFGGANCEGIMGAETLRSFPFVDAAVSGEGDIVFPELVQRVLSGGSASGLEGVRTRDRLKQELAFNHFSQAPMVREMDSLPVPEYADYFEQFKSSRYDRDWQPSIFFETSRGCWWGERQHCTFCGLNGSSMTFRGKSPGRAVDELVHLVGRHPECDVQVVDNILDMRYFHDVLPALAERRLNVSLFYEVKSNLKKEQVRLLAASGIRQVQPGIESLSDSVLKVMRKGVTGLQNVQLLKWCKQFGVEPMWNFLWGFPGEDPHEYQRMAAFARYLTHLPPPTSSAEIRLDRFSPNFFDAEKLGFADVRPLPAYRHVYALADEAVSNLAYYFTFRYLEPRDVDGYTRPLVRELDKWKKTRGRSELFSIDISDRLVIWDLRPVSQRPCTVLAGLDRLLYLECDSVRDIRHLADIASNLRAPSSESVDWEADVERRLSPLVASGLVLRDGSRYLALAIPLGDYTLAPTAVREFSRVLKELGAPSATGWIVRLDGDGLKHARPSIRRRAKPAGRRRIRPPRIRGLARSQFSVDSRGRLIVRACPGQVPGERRH